MKQFFCIFLIGVAVVMISLVVLITLGAVVELMECRSFAREYRVDTEWHPLKGCVIDPSGAAFLMPTIEQAVE